MASPSPASLFEDAGIGLQRRTSPGPSRSTSAHSHASFGTHSGRGWTTWASSTEPRSHAVPQGSSSAKTLSSTS